MPVSSSDPADKPPSLTVDKYLGSTRLPVNLDDIAGELLTRGENGAETVARQLTTVFGKMHEAGVLDRPYVVPRSKLEGARKRDGEKKLKDLSKRTPPG